MILLEALLFFFICFISNGNTIFAQSYIMHTCYVYYVVKNIFMALILLL